MGRAAALFLALFLLFTVSPRAEPLQKRDASGRSVVIPTLSDESSRWFDHIPASEQALLNPGDFRAYQAALKDGHCVAARDILFDKGFATHYPELRLNLEEVEYYGRWLMWISEEWYPAYARCDGLARAKAGRMLAALDRSEMTPYRPPDGHVQGMSEGENVRNAGLRRLFFTAIYGYVPAIANILEFEKTGDVRLADEIGLFFRLMIKKKGAPYPGLDEEISTLRDRLKDVLRAEVHVAVRTECWLWVVTDCSERSQWRGGPPLLTQDAKLLMLIQEIERNAGSR